MNSISLADAIMRHAVGYDHLRNITTVTTNYPPHNIVKVTEDRFEVTIAVAGFAEAELAVTEENGDMIVTGRKAQADLPAGHAFLYRGIGLRDFERRFRLGDNVHVLGARLENGLLVIDVERQVPEAKKAKRIAIQ